MRCFHARRILVTLLILCLLPFSIHGQEPRLLSATDEQKIDSMISKMSLEEKIDLIGGVDGMFIRDVKSIGLPKLKTSDGPVGVRTWGPSTAFTAGIALAATWDPELAKRVGVCLGQDARARGVHFLLGPGVNIYRAPMNGRNFEYFGEDPFLAAQMTVGYVRGVQSQGVVATVKHFALNNQEWDRHNVSSNAEERTMREIYFPAFEAAVRDGHIGAVMNSYNLINGVHATENLWMNNQVLKRDWGFDGILMSDWGSTYDGIAAANAGLDLEMPRGEFMNRTTLLPAVRQGKVTEAIIDDKVRRILRTALRFSFFDRPQEDLTIPRYDQSARKVALDEALESIVLLKNEQSLLPLDKKKIHTIALLGPDLWPIVTGAGGSSTVTPYQSVSLLENLSSVPGLKVQYAAGIPTLAQLIGDTDFASEVNVESFLGPDFTGTRIQTTQQRLNDWRAGDWVPPGEPGSYRYTATFLPKTTGSYLFLTVAAGEDSYTLYIDSKQVLQQPRSEGQAPRFAELSLTAGKPVSVRVDYVVRASKARFGLGIRAADELVSPEAKQIAALADVALVSVGFDAWNEAEGFDRSYALPFGQEALIHAVRSANKNVIVLLTAGGDVDTSKWLGDVPVFLHNWYPGQEGGAALTDILTGVRSPEGKLPISFARSWEQNPVHDHYYAPPVPEGHIPGVDYAEGVFLGYRYFTGSTVKPLYPFGFGLSYTSFSFSDLRVSPITSVDGKFKVSFEVSNTGHMAGAEVAQLYVGDPSANVKRPAKELKGFKKIRLAPGAKTRVTLNLDQRSLSYWDESAHTWRADSGKFQVFVGDSSENTPLTTELVYKPEQ